MANYLVASGSRKVSQLEIATNPVPADSASAMLLVIGDAFPATNATTVQITPDNFLTNLVFDADETYTGDNTFSGNNTFNGTNDFSPITNFNGAVYVSASYFYTGSMELNGSSVAFNESETVFTNQVSLLPYQTTILGDSITMTNVLGNQRARLKSENGSGFLLQDYDGVSDTFDTVLQVQESQGDIHLKRNTVISGSLTVQEVFYVYETASFMNSSGSTTFGDTIDDKHLFTGSIYLSGSIAIIDGGLVDGVDLNVFSSSVQVESASFALRLTQDEADLALLSASYENFSGSQYNDDSASFSFDITENSQSLSLLSASFEATSSQIFDDIDYLSGSFEATSSQVFDDIDLLSGSFEATSSQVFDDIDFLSSSFVDASSSFSTRVTQNEGDISLLSGSYETFSGSQYNNDSSSFSADITQNLNDISLLSGSYETFSGSQYNNDSASFSTRVTTMEDFSASLDDTFATDAELASVSQSFETDVDTLSGSFSTRVTTNETDISNLQTDSGSFSTRVTNNETDISNLQTDSGSFSTRVTNNETDISNLQTDSGSFSTRVTTNETDISDLQTASGSFSTRVTTNETDISNSEVKYSVSVIGTNTNAVIDTLYVLTASLTLTLPGSPTVGDRIGVSNQSGTTTPVIGRNGNLIQGLASDLTLDVDGMGINLIYTGATKGWIIL